MLKVMMARPVGDTLKTLRGDGNGSTKTITARSPNFHLVHGSISDLLGNTLAVTKWFQFIGANGKAILINADHVAWIEEVDESRTRTQLS
jgi:hypothetical protein